MYLDEIAGAYTEEKETYLEEELLRLSTYEEKKWEMADARKQGKITEEEYTAFLKEAISAKTRIDAVNSLLKKAESLKTTYENTGVRGSFVKDTGYVHFLNQRTDYLLLIFLILYCSRFFLCENEKRANESPMQRC